MAQVLTNLAIARGLTRLTGQLRQLAGQLFDDIIHAGKVRLGTLQLKLGLMATLIQARNTGGLFQNAAARLGFGVDQFRNLTLPHQSGRMRTGRGIREQHLNIARPHIPRVRLIGRPRIPRDPAHDFQHVLIVEPRRRDAVRVVDGQTDLGEIPCGATGRTGKDHVLHPTAAHGGRAVFPHDPAQRLKQVGFATAIRPHHPGQAVGNDQLCRIDKAFKAIESEAIETQIWVLFDSCGDKSFGRTHSESSTHHPMWPK